MRRALLTLPRPVSTGSATIASFAANTAGGANAITINRPTGTADGDLLIAALGNDGTNGWATLSGWTALATSSGSTGLWKIAASEPTNYTFTHAGFLNSNIGTIIRVTGATGAPILASNVAAMVNGSNVVLPSISPGSSGTLIQMVQTLTGVTVTWTPPGGTAEAYDSGVNGGNGVAGGTQAVGSGPTGTRTWVGSSNGNTFGLVVAVAAA